MDDLRSEHLLLADLASTDDRSYFSVSKRHAVSLVDNALHAGYITVSALNVCRLTPSGLQRLSHLTELLASAQQQAHQLSAQDTKQKRATVSDRVFQLLLTLLSFSLGILAEHFSGVIDFLIGLLH